MAIFIQNADFVRLEFFPFLYISVLSLRKRIPFFPNSLIFVLKMDSFFQNQRHLKPIKDRPFLCAFQDNDACPFYVGMSFPKSVMYMARKTHDKVIGNFYVLLYIFFRSDSTGPHVKVCTCCFHTF